MSKVWLVAACISALISILTLAIGLSVYGVLDMFPGGIIVITGVLATMLFCACAFDCCDDYDDTRVITVREGESVELRVI